MLGKSKFLSVYAPKNPAHVSHSALNLQDTKEYFEAESKTLMTLMTELGHDHVDLLKLDIEGAEFSVLQHMMEWKIFPKILCIEFDEALQTDRKDRSTQWIRRIEHNGYYQLVNERWNLTFVNESNPLESAVRRLYLKVKLFLSK